MKNQLFVPQFSVTIDFYVSNVPQFTACKLNMKVSVVTFLWEVYFCCCCCFECGLDRVAVSITLTIKLAISEIAQLRFIELCPLNVAVFARHLSIGKHFPELLERIEIGTQYKNSLAKCHNQSLFNFCFVCHWGKIQMIDVTTRAHTGSRQICSQEWLMRNAFVCVHTRTHEIKVLYFDCHVLMWSDKFP